VHRSNRFLHFGFAWILTCCLSSCSDEAVPELTDGPMDAETLAVVVSRGKQLYNKHGCSDCHGPGGHGDGRIAQALQPPPRDFRRPENFRFGYEIAHISNTIRDGIAADRRVMPKYGHLSVRERHFLARYIRSLANEAPVK
jgi:mono/diheme cytochrome c family protein